MKNTIGAVILIVLGVIFLLNNLGIANLHLGALLAKWWPVIKWWPLILIAYGVALLFKRG